jgi:hypothetical protein
MLDLANVHRSQYHPSGNVNWSRFVIGVILLVLAGCLSGVILMLLYNAAFAIHVLLAVAAPFVVALVLGLLVYRIIDWSHCRNPKAAMVVGALCGMMTFAASHHALNVALRCRDGGTLANEIFRFDPLPEFEFSKPDSSKPKPAVWQPAARINLPRAVFLLLEFAILAWLPIFYGREAARRAYFEKSGRWFKRSVVRAEPNSGDRLEETLRAEGDLSEPLNGITLHSHDPRPEEPKLFRVTHRTKEQAQTAWMQLEYHVNENTNEWQDAYLTVTEIGDNGRKTLVFRQLQLNPSEFAAARTLFAT